MVYNEINEVLGVGDNGINQGLGGDFPGVSNGVFPRIFPGWCIGGIFL